MRKIITILLITTALHGYGADSTKVYNLSLQAKLISYVAPLCASPENDSLFTTFLDWRVKFRKSNPSANTTVVTDSIPTTELAKLYNYCLSNADGMAVAKDFKQAIATARTANSYLDKLCTDYEAIYSARFSALRISGKKLLIGK